MLDGRNLALLNQINEECVGSGYKVLSVTELAQSLPQSYGADEFCVLQGLKFLCEREYISIKYQDEKEVCLCPQPKGRIVFEKRIDEQMERQSVYAKTFIYSTLGGALGGMFGTIITWLFIKAIGGV